MYFTQGTLFQYAFFFVPGEGDDTSVSFDEVNSWCNENLTGQWLIFDNCDTYSGEVSTTFYSRAVHDSPINDVNYPPAKIKIEATYIYVFELEEDATAFKLRWDQVNVC